MALKQCMACGLAFQPRPQTPRQHYCPEPECQRERRRRWQQAKRQTDADYRDNQTRAQQSWCERHPDYWRGYRDSHPTYAEANRAQQHERNRRQHSGQIAKMGASPAGRSTADMVPSGSMPSPDIDPNVVTDDAVMRFWKTSMKPTLQREDAI